MKASNLIRVVAAALVLSTLSFAAGVAGDLSLADGPRSGTRVVLRIPPELPADTPRAAPLPLVSTPAAEARLAIQPVRVQRIERIEPIEPVELIAPPEKPAPEPVLAAPPKADPALASKHEDVHAA